MNMEIILLDKLENKDNLFVNIVKLEQEFFPEYPYNLNDIKDAHQKSRGKSLVVIYENKLIGYLIPMFFENKNYVQILTIAINKNFQRKGLGKQLIRTFEDSLKLENINIILARADISFPILKMFKYLKYKPMNLKEINYFIEESIFSSEDKLVEIKEKCSNKDILNLFKKAFIIIKDIKKRNPFSFIPVIKNIS